jgi:SAM-dependent methyltransferase
MASRLLDRLPTKNEYRAFDYGCGDGTFMRLLSARGMIVTGCDVSAELVAHANGAMVGGVETLAGVQSESLGLVCAMNVLGYVPLSDGDLFYREASRIVRRGGHLLMAQGNSRIVNPKRYNPIGLSDPEKYPIEMKNYGFEEVAREWGNCLLPKWKRLFVGRAAKTVDPKVIDRMPIEYRQKACSIYFSLLART